MKSLSPIILIVFLVSTSYQGQTPAKQVAKPVTAHNAAEAPPAKKAVPLKVIVTFTTDTDCSLKVDGTVQANLLKVGEPMKVPLSIRAHKVEALSVANIKDRWEDTIDLSKRDTNPSVNIKLMPILTKRLDEERKAASYRNGEDYGYINRAGQKIWSNLSSKTNNPGWLSRVWSMKSYEQGRWEIGVTLLCVFLIGTGAFFFKLWTGRLWVGLATGFLALGISRYGMVRWGIPKIEEQEWQKATASNKVADFKRHLVNWPRGKYVEAARSALSQPISLPYKGEAIREMASANGSFSLTGTSYVAPGSLTNALTTFIPVGDDYRMEGTLSRFELDGVVVDLASNSYQDGVVHTKYFGDLKCTLAKYTLQTGASLSCTCTQEQSEALHEFMKNQKSPARMGSVGQGLAK